MRKKSIKVIIVTLISVALLISINIYRSNLGNLYGYSRAALSYYGSTGQEVIDIQSKLYKWGYYNGIVDGDYGYKTFQAVKWFQSKHGLVVDGVAGPQTLSALGLPSGANRAPQTGSTGNRDTDLLARLIHGEARGEPYLGQVAVAAVIMNRTRDDRFPKTIAGVIYQPGAFDAVADGQINLAPSTAAYNAARDALNGWDPTYGCVYYYNPATATSKWIWSRPIMLKIGNHNFAK